MNTRRPCLLCGGHTYRLVCDGVEDREYRLVLLDPTLSPEALTASDPPDYHAFVALPHDSLRTDRELFFAPLNFDYHAEHHLYMAIPFYNLPRAHRLLAALERYREPVDVERGYVRFPPTRVAPDPGERPWR